MSDKEPDGSEQSEKQSPSKTKRVVQSIISLVVVVGIFVGVMPQIADYSEVWGTIRSLTWLESISLAAVAFWNLATYWFVLVAALPGLRLKEAAVVNQSSTAVSNTLPGGGAIGVGVTLAMLTSWGFTIAAITRSAVVTGIWNNFVKLGMPILALGLLAIETDVSNTWISASAIGLAVLLGAVVAFWMILRSDRMARSVSSSLQRLLSRLLRAVRMKPVAGLAERVSRFRSDTVGLLQHRWFQLTLATLVSHLSLYVVLLITLRHVGVSQEELSWIQALAAFSFVRLISALPITPGGVGVVELGYVAALTIGLDQATDAQVVAAILVFRAITYALPIPLGAGSYILWRRNQSWRLTETARTDLAGDAYTTAAAAS